MIAVTMSAAAFSSLSLYTSFAGLIFAGLLLAPQAFKRDKRVIAAVLAVALFVVVGHAIEAGPFICPYQGTWMEFMCYFP